MYATLRYVYLDYQIYVFRDQNLARIVILKNHEKYHIQLMNFCLSKYQIHLQEV